MNSALLTSSWSLPASVAVFAVAALSIGFFGTLLTRIAAVLAVRTGLGQVIMGALFVGATTSLAEIVTSTTAAWQGFPELAVSNAIGSIAGQTAFLAIADLAYRRANLEHAAASAAVLMLGAFLITLLSLPLLAMAVPGVAWLGVHPLSLALFVLYIWGMRLVAAAQRKPMWLPRQTRETILEISARPPRDDRSTSILWLQFAGAATTTAVAGWGLARAAIGISEQSGLSETVVGGLFTGLSSSVPELVTALVAVRMGQLTLAVADVVGGNAFDTLIVALSDAAYREGPIYLALGGQQVFLIGQTILLTGLLVMGLVRRQEHGIANIGTEGVLVIAVYAGAFLTLAFAF